MNARSVFLCASLIACLAARSGPACAGDGADRLRKLLTDAYQTDDIRAQRKALGEIRNMGAGPELIGLLKDDNKAVREGALSVIGMFPEAARQAVPALIEILGGKDEGLKMLSAAALAGLGPDAKDAVPALIAVIKDEELRKTDSGACLFAADALGRIGPAARDSAAALGDMAADKRLSPATQGMALGAIDAITGPQPGRRGVTDSPAATP